MSESSPATNTFIGKGTLHRGPWFRTEGAAAETALDAEGHPAHYEADDDLVAAVNTALLLDKPLLVTGNPGTGKSDLAERIAWEFQLGPVLRFEAQSLSEANDLFYRFDLIGRMAATRERSVEPSEAVSRVARPKPSEGPSRADFVEFGALGKAILRSGVRMDSNDIRQQSHFEQLRQNALKRRLDWAVGQPRRSVVLIDEIDKASRDFPNDLLNGIDRMEFRIRELDQMLLKAPPRGAGLHPIVIITSNLERDLPGPFLRRCAFHNIGDPDRERLARIVNLRVFNRDRGSDLGPEGTRLPGFYGELLDCYLAFRKEQGDRQAHPAGPTELIDVSRVLHRGGRVAPTARWVDGLPHVLAAIGALAKQREDALALRNFLVGWKIAG